MHGSPVNIRFFTPGDAETAVRAARMLVDGFREFAPGSWPDEASALAEMEGIIGAGGFLAGAFEADRLIGWAGGLPFNGAAAWELHPLVVDAKARRHGVGRAVVDAVAAESARRGAAVLFAGSDDVTEGTSLGGTDVWDDPLAHLARIRNLRAHPYEFYQRVGFKLVGVLPDANGPGRPDLWLARPLLEGRPGGA